MKLTIEDIITGNKFKHLSDEYLDEEKTYIDISKKPKIIFLKTDWIEKFKEKILPQINYSFKLVTHNADRPAPSNNIDLLDDHRLIKWYGMNCEIQHPKLQPIPIGIANEKWPHGNKQELLEVVNTDVPKLGLCYSNFDVTTNYTRRPDIFRILHTKSFVNIDTHKHYYKNYLTVLKNYKYVISPPGNSVDCHRVWESIYLGVVPIIEKHLAMEYFYGLPIYIIDSFMNLTQQELEVNYESIRAKPIDKSLFSYYKNLIQSS